MRSAVGGSAMGEVGREGRAGGGRGATAGGAGDEEGVGVEEVGQDGREVNEGVEGQRPAHARHRLVGMLVRAAKHEMLRVVRGGPQPQEVLHSENHHGDVFQLVERRVHLRTAPPRGSWAPNPARTRALCRRAFARGLLSPIAEEAAGWKTFGGVRTDLSKPSTVLSTKHAMLAMISSTENNSCSQARAVASAFG
jgi:hypothetical protein